MFLFFGLTPTATVQGRGRDVDSSRGHVQAHAFTRLYGPPSRSKATSNARKNSLRRRLDCPQRGGRFRLCMVAASDIRCMRYDTQDVLTACVTTFLRPRGINSDCMSCGWVRCQAEARGGNSNIAPLPSARCKLNGHNGAMQVGPPHNACVATKPSMLATIQLSRRKATTLSPARSPTTSAAANRCEAFPCAGRTMLNVQCKRCSHICHLWMWPLRGLRGHFWISITPPILAVGTLARVPRPDSREQQDEPVTKPVSQVVRSRVGA